MTSLTELYPLLHQHFGALTGPSATRPWWPLFSDDPAFEIIVGAVLVQQTRWETVEAAVLRLIDAGLLAPRALADADPTALGLLIRPSAFHSQKAPGLIRIARHICERYGGNAAAMLTQPTAQLRAELLALPRVGPETCDVIMLYAGGHAVFVVDEYTRRVLERVGVLAANDVNKGQLSFWRRASYEGVRLTIEAALSEPISCRHHSDLPALYAEYHAQINEVCVRYCLARPRCDGPPARRVYSRQEGRESYLDRDEGCPLRTICGYYGDTRADILVNE